MSESKTLPRKEPTLAPANAPVMNPNKTTELDDLPKDAVALIVWRELTGPQPMTIVVTLDSWERNRKAVMESGAMFYSDRIYEFESPINLKGRQTIFHLQGVTGWAANVDTGIGGPPATD